MSKKMTLSPIPFTERDAKKQGIYFEVDKTLTERIYKNS